MKKKSVALVLILATLFAAVCVVVACDANGGKDLTVSFDQDANLLSWSANWATTYSVIIYDANGEILQKTSLTKGTSELQLDLPAGEYTVEITAYEEKGAGKTTQIQITVKSLNVVEEDPADGGEDGDDDVVSDKGEPVKILSNTYYYLKSDDGDLSIGLVNTSGVSDVVAFGLINEMMWEYDADNNELLLKSYFLHRFSSGAVLNIDVEYLDGNDDRFDVQIVDVMPLQVIGGEDGMIEADISSMALNKKIYLGYDGKVLKEKASSIVEAVCIDGKLRDKSDYLKSIIQAEITLSNVNVLSKLKSGLHYVEIFTTYGKSAVWLNIINGKENVACDVTIDFDSSYPKVFVTWDIFNDADYYIVDINGAEYSSVAYPQLFDGNSFDATDKIAYGETVTVKSVFNGTAKFSAASKATLNVNIYSSIVAKYLSYEERSFEFLGTTYNYFINGKDEFFDLIYYSLLFYDELDASAETGCEKKITFYPVSSYITSESAALVCFKQVVPLINEAVKYDTKTLLAKNVESSGVYEIHLKVESTFVPNAPDVTQMPAEQNKFQDVHYSSTGRATDYEGFAVNGYEKEATVRLSEELYVALELGIRPVPVAGSSAYAIYEKAKSVLRQIIDDGMNDYQKVHAIYDWLGENVTYDWDISTKMGNIPSSSSEYNKFYAYRQFYLEGVFIDKLAVCNGIAKAMSLLCGIEGIECYKIKGTSGGATSAHAWNKVNVDGNWYVIDATWANRKYTSSSISGTEKEVLAHYNLFMSEASSGNVSNGAHEEASTGGRYTGCYAGSVYNVFANTFFTYEHNLYDYVIDSAYELQVLINYYKDKCEVNQFIAIDVSCDLTALNQYRSSILVTDCFIELYDYKGAMSGVSTVIIAKR